MHERWRQVLRFEPEERALFKREFDRERAWSAINAVLIWPT